MNNCSIILFGATGDLVKRKLIPALYRLMETHKLTQFIVVGAAIGASTVDEIMIHAQEFVPNRDAKLWNDLKSRMYYQQLDFTRVHDYGVLHEMVQKLEEQHNLSGNRIIYLACAASFFADITQNIAHAGIARREENGVYPWYRVVYEKPFGHDALSAQLINESIARVLHEQQIYRIDHYLTKELVSNITLMRFTNCFFEPLWNSAYIDQIQIILSENIGIEGRAAYYDRYGALCDVVQNHVLELIALVAMEAPGKLTGDFIRVNRADVLKKVYVAGGSFGQYEGYTDNEGVRPNSTTETFVQARFLIDNLRWKGVPFYIKTGKRLDKKETVIHIKFKQVACLLVHGCPVESNWLTMKIAPDALFSLYLNVKKPGRGSMVVPIAMEFCHSSIFGRRMPEEAYEVLLEEVMRGEQSVSVRCDEIEYAWRIIDQIRSELFPLYSYKQGSRGPEQAIKDFERTYNMEWRS